MGTSLAAKLKQSYRICKLETTIITRFINWLKRNHFELIQVDPDGGYKCHTLDSVRKQWEQRHQRT